MKTIYNFRETVFLFNLLNVAIFMLPVVCLIDQKDKGSVVWKSSRLSGHIVTKEKWFGFFAMTTNATSSKISFTITFNLTEDIKPKLLTYVDIQVASILPNMTCNEKLQVIESQSDRQEIVRNVISLGRGNTRYCVKAGPKVVCQGVMAYRTSTARRMYLAVANCNSSNGLDFTYDVTMSGVKKFSCEQLQYDKCRLFYNYTQFPNTVGYINQQDMMNKSGITGVLSAFRNKSQGKVCHQFVMQVMCAVFFPPCENNSTSMLCRKTCQEVEEACMELLKATGIVLNCAFLPVSLGQHVCEDKQVDCGPLQPPKYGSVDLISNHTTLNATAIYACRHSNYKLSGPDTRVCTYSGRWTGVQPICTETGLGIVTICVIIGVVFLVGFTLTTFRHEIKIWFYVRFCCVASGRQEDQCQQSADAFVLYDSRDESAKTQLLQRLNAHHRLSPGFHVKTRKGTPGTPVTQNILEDINQTNKIIVLLSRNFIRSCWCQYEFHCVHSCVKYKSRNSIILVVIDDFSGKRVNPEICAYTSIHNVLRLGDNLFWDRLLYILRN